MVNTLTLFCMRFSLFFSCFSSFSLQFIRIFGLERCQKLVFLFFVYFIWKTVIWVTKEGNEKKKVYFVRMKINLCSPWQRKIKQVHGIVQCIFSFSGAKRKTHFSSLDLFIVELSKKKKTIFFGFIVAIGTQCRPSFAKIK